MSDNVEAKNGDAGSSRVTSKLDLHQFIAQRKKEMMKNKSTNNDCNVYDPCEKASSYLNATKKDTAYVLDRALCMHYCPWDSRYPENPQRLTAIEWRLNELNLLSRCTRVEIGTPLSDSELTTLHTSDTIEKLREISESSLVEMEKCAANYDAIYFNKHTYEAAKSAVSGVLALARAVAQDTFKNGFAIVRPPGHHAMQNEYCGYCYFNNVAITADKLISEGLVKKVFILDFDIHHGQGTQQMFYERNDVLYFSIHRYQHGAFWPNLQESDSSYIGDGKGVGYNINVPLNETGLGDAEYLAIVFNLLLPIAYEYKPDIILMSAGYDAAIGCPEGEMKVTPGFYGHLITLLSGLANGKIVACLEGGYFLPSLAEGAAMTLKGLLGDPCGILDPIHQVRPTVIKTINDVKFHLKNHWHCFNDIDLFEFPKEGVLPTDQNSRISSDEHLVIHKYVGVPGKAPFDTSNCYPVQTDEEINDFSTTVQMLANRCTEAAKQVGYVYDETMTLHESDKSKVMPERPERIQEIIEFMKKYSLTHRCLKIVPEMDDSLSYIQLIHAHEYINKLMNNSAALNGVDVYVNEHTFQSIDCAVIHLLSLVDAIFQKKITSGVAVIRPPGHHAHRDKCSGFCLVNNVAVAAIYVAEEYKVKRTLIIDFDVHHGDGTQAITYYHNNVMYISVHRFDFGNYFPNDQSGDYNHQGQSEGEGFNVNIPLNEGKMGDVEYVRIFHSIILPIAYSYCPDMIFISAGFDAVYNDPLGGYKVSPETFGHMVQWLKPLAGGKIILALEGGYNIRSTAVSFCMCIKALLGDPIPTPNIQQPIKPTALESINNVILAQKEYWPILEVNKKIANNVFEHDDICKLKCMIGQVKMSENNKYDRIRAKELQKLTDDFEELRRMMNGNAEINICDSPN